MAQTTLSDYLRETEDAMTAGRIDDALARCELVLAQFPEALEVQRLLGEVYLAQNRLEEAQQFFDWILTNDPENVQVYCNRALVCERMYDVDTALDCYQQAYELSRGNSQIRQDFNQLSAKIGQPGFMFSRAGLARLYMRGDLLSQAIQEWEVVLSISPDRLDARTGLMEAYWREGLYGKAEQIGRQLLQDVPACEKALLLLAFITVTKSKMEAQDLLKRAEALDPELGMARELFADMMVSQPSHPLFQLMKNTPVLLTLEEQEETVLPPVKETPVAHTETASTAPEQWGAGTWSSFDDLISVPQEQQPTQEVTPSPLAAWASSAGLESSWATPEQSQSTPAVPASSLPPSTPGFADAWKWEMAGDKSALEPWNKQLEEFQSAAQDATLSPAAPSTYDFGTSFSSLPPLSPPDSASEKESPWAASPREEDSTPAWLSMLTNNEPQTPKSDSGSASWPGLAQESPKTPARVETPAPAPVPQPAREPVKSYEEPQPIVSAQDDDEAPFFGPEWLKSLGATTFEEEQPLAVEQMQPPAASASETSSFSLADLQGASQGDFWSQDVQSRTFGSPTSSFEPLQSTNTWGQPQQELPVAEVKSQSALDATMTSWMHLQQEHVVEETPVQVEPSNPTEFATYSSTWQPAEQEAYPSWSSMLSKDAEYVWGAHPTEATPPAEQNLLTTLESLEQNLLSQGFVPLEPNTLSVIAQSQDEVAPTMESAVPAKEEAQPEKVAYGQDDSSMLSSALAQFGALAQPEPNPLPPVTPVPDPVWSEPLRVVPTPPPSYAPQAPVPPVGSPRTEAPREPVTRVAASMPAPIPTVAPMQTVKEMPLVPVARAESVRPAQPVRASSIPAPVYQAPAETSKAPVARGDALLDNELETTMKRPAIRLQAMQQAQRQPSPVQAQVDFTTLVGRGQASTGRQESVHANYQDRLLRGYQHQLVGDYDEAMQEYRLIIRNAPELLGEVVSNVRALLKLAPKYSAGYRVLGDAYMRQGEYLQAMEAYNKALTMAKKARG